MWHVQVLLSNQEQPLCGYLVTDAVVAHSSPSHEKQSLATQWKSIQELQAKNYEVKHLFRGEPERIVLPQESSHYWGKRLSEKAHHPTHPDRDMTQMFVNTTLLEVQKVTVVEDGNMFEFGCLPSKRKPIVNDFPQFLKSVTVNWAVFRDEVRRQIQLKDEMLQAEPRFAFDFQLLIDRQGNVYQIDLATAGKDLRHKVEQCQKSFGMLLDALSEHDRALRNKI